MLSIDVGCVVGSPAGPAIVGSGVAKQETRKVGEFHGVKISAAFKASVSIGPETSVIVEADDNLIGLIEAEVCEGHLVVAYKPGISASTKSPQKVTIVTPRLDAIVVRGAAVVEATVRETPRLTVDVDGAGRATARGVASDSVGLYVTGSGGATLEGSGRVLKLHVQGASVANLAGIAFERATVLIDGASKAEVQASKSIGGEVLGASSLQVRGAPKGRTVKTSGASTVQY